MGAASDLKGAFSLALQILERTGAPPPRPAPSSSPVAWGSPDASCRTCGDTYKVGNPGHEVSCPSCVVEVIHQKCMVCSGTGKVGAKNHRVGCPSCQGRVR